MSCLNTHHKVNADLSTKWGAQHDRGQLVHECIDVVADVHALKVSPMASALAHDILGDRVEGDKGQGRAEVLIST